MKRKLSGRVKLILILAVVLAAATAITAALSGTVWGGRTVQAILTPIRSGVSALTRQAERYYNYIFNYEALEAKNYGLASDLQIELQRKMEELQKLYTIYKRNLF